MGLQIRRRWENKREIGLTFLLDDARGVERGDQFHGLSNHLHLVLKEVILKDCSSLEHCGGIWTR